MSTTIDGVPWRQFRPLGEEGPTYDELNRDCLAPLSREHGLDLCLHPFSGVIDFTGFGCEFCEQTLTEASSGETAKDLRTQAILATYPHLAKR